MSKDAIIAIAIVLVAAIGTGIYLYANNHAKEKRREQARARGPIEHAECDIHRGEIARLQAELGLIQSDPLREGNARGELAKNRALLSECERQRNRDDQS